MFRSLGNETVFSPEDVEVFVAPFRDDFAAAVDQFVRRLLPETADRRLIDRIATDMAATSREVALGCLRYARNRQSAILAALPHIAAPIVAINPGIGLTTSTRCAGTVLSRSFSTMSVISRCSRPRSG